MSSVGSSTIASAEGAPAASIRTAAAAISRFASTIDGLRRELLLDPDFEHGVERSLRDGRHENPAREPDRFTTAYLHLPAELEDEVRAAEAG